MKLRDALRIPAADITDEAVYRDRRRLLAAFATAPALAVAGCGRAEPPPPPKTTITPEQAKSGFRTDEELTSNLGLHDVTSALRIRHAWTAFKIGTPVPEDEF